jgi:hypothetical protein
MIQDLKARIFFLASGALLSGFAVWLLIRSQSDTHGFAQLLLLEIAGVALLAPILGHLKTLPKSGSLLGRTSFGLFGFAAGVFGLVLAMGSLSFTRSVIFQGSVLGYGAALFFGSFGLCRGFGLAFSVFVNYGIAALVMTFPWYGSAFIEALSRESQPWALSMSLQISPVFVVGGTFLEMDVLVSERLYLAFPVGQQWPYSYASPERVGMTAWAWGAVAFCAHFMISRLVRQRVHQ